jgi:hypothetical protein
MLLSFFLPHLKGPFFFFLQTSLNFCLHHTSFASGKRFIIIDTQSTQIQHRGEHIKEGSNGNRPASQYANNTTYSNSNTTNDSYQVRKHAF